MPIKQAQIFRREFAFANRKTKIKIQNRNMGKHYENKRKPKREGKYHTVGKSKPFRPGAARPSN
jgi:hypothetical protein